MDFLKKPKVVVIIQARMASTRLPAKVTLPLHGISVLEHVITRCQSAKLVDEVVVAAPDSIESLAIKNIVEKLKNVFYFEGEEFDVLQRYYAAAKKFHADIIVRITSDCPVIDPTILDIMINNFLTLNSIAAEKIDYYSSGIERTLPRGLDAEIFTMQVLEQAYKEANAEPDREHVTRYIYNNPNKFSIVGFKFHLNLSNYRLTLDTQEDYAMFVELFKYFQKDEKMYLWNIMQVLKKHPYIALINSAVEQKIV